MQKVESHKQRFQVPKSRHLDPEKPSYSDLEDEISRLRKQNKNLEDEIARYRKKTRQVIYIL